MLGPMDHTCTSEVLCVSMNTGKGREPASAGCDASAPAQRTLTVLLSPDCGKVRTCLQSHSYWSLGLNRAVCCKAMPFLQQCGYQNVPDQSHGGLVRPHGWKLAQPGLHVSLSTGALRSGQGWEESLPSSVSHHPS